MAPVCGTDRASAAETKAVPDPLLFPSVHV